MASEVAYINKNMLKWARSETPFADAPEVIASRLNISIERFLSWEDEASDEYPSLARAKEIAKIYKMPVAAFYLAAPQIKASFRFSFIVISMMWHADYCFRLIVICCWNPDMPVLTGYGRSSCYCFAAESFGSMPHLFLFPIRSVILGTSSLI